MTIDDNISFMQQALQQARFAKRDVELPFGAVIVQNETVVSRGRCRETKRKTVLAHAEAEAVDKACRKLGRSKLTDCVIFVRMSPARCVRQLFFKQRFLM